MDGLVIRAKFKLFCSIFEDVAEYVAAILKNLVTLAPFMELFTKILPGALHFPKTQKKCYINFHNILISEGVIIRRLV